MYALLIMLAALWLRLPFGLSKVPAHTWWLIGFVLAFALGWWGVQALRERWQEHRTREWPVVDGTISELQAHKVSGPADGADYWKLEFRYTYRLLAEHTGVYALNLVSETLRDQAMAGLAGKSVRVHYSDENEAESVLWEDEVWGLW